MIIGIGVFGGVGESLTLTDGCKKAAELGLRELRKARTAVQAVTIALTHLEKDGRYNAGCGGAVHAGTIRINRPQGMVALDAGVMYSNLNSARTGSVSGVSAVYTPSVVARELMSGKTGATTLWGKHADEFALSLGLERRRTISPQARERYLEMMRGFGSNFYTHSPSDFSNNHSNHHLQHREIETVGVVARDHRGRYAAGVSTGCFASMPKGRMSDAAMPGVGFIAGPDGGVAFTGIGEEIKNRVAASQVYYKWLAVHSAKEACERAVRLFPSSIPVGLIAINETGIGICANDQMPHALLFE